MDLAMPLMNGCGATTLILQERAAPKVIILSTYSDEKLVTEAVRAGAMAYVVKRSAAADLLQAIREVRNGNAFFSPEIARYMREQRREALVTGQPMKTRSESLTTRELQVLSMVARGGSNKAMSIDLGISVKTVEKHRQQLMNKLNIHEAAGLTRHAISLGLIESVKPEENTPANTPEQ
jgi:DNA-binding NarL/FixJ family response regulator